VTKIELRNELAKIVGKSARRGPNPRLLSRVEALAIVDQLAERDNALAWDCVLEGEAVLRQVIGVYRAM